MTIANTMLTVIIFIALPLFLLYKIYSLISGNLKFYREQKEKRNMKEMQYLDLKMLELQQQIEFYKKSNEYYPEPADERPDNSKEGGYHGNYRKNNDRRTKPSAR